MEVKFELDAGAIAPTRNHDTDAGWDLYLNETKQVPPDTTVLFDTGTHVLIPPGYVGLLLPRSSSNCKSVLSFPLGVIDAGYTGSIKVAAKNTFSDTEHYEDVPQFIPTLKHGQRVMQLVILPLPAVTLVQGKVTAEDTERNADGFGSSGA